MNSALLPFTEFTPTGPSTIVLIHGGFCSGKEWEAVLAHLFNYHVLVPDMPGHGLARELYPSFSIPLAAELIAKLIPLHAKNGKAHVVGFSLGAHVVVEILYKYPSITSDSVVSGYNILPSMNPSFFACSAWVSQQIGAVLPKSFIQWYIGEDKVPIVTNRTFAYCKALSALCTEHWPEPWPARTLVIAAGDPSAADHAEDALKVADIGRKGNAETAAYIHPAKRHAWNRQDPELFARTICAWFERSPLPDGFKEIRNEDIVPAKWMLFPR